MNRQGIRTIWMIKLICHNSNSACVRVESVHLILQTRGRAEVLNIAIDCVGEINVFILRVDGHIVQRVKLATKVVVENEM